MTPLYLIYFVLSYTIGCEWSSTKYTGNSESYIFYFLFILISSLMPLLYSLSIFPKNVESRFRKKGLALYSVLFTVFILLFASMWIKEVVEVMSTGTARVYDMGLVMFMSNDPAFLLRNLVVFSILALIIFIGFIYVPRNYKLKI